MLRPKSSQLSFYGKHIYDRVIPKGHFLKLLDRAVDFSLSSSSSATIIKKNRQGPRLRKRQMKPEITRACRERPKIER
jgi:hypothetical protein